MEPGLVGHVVATGPAEGPECEEDDRAPRLHSAILGPHRRPVKPVCKP
jgi:hypothetical protein